MMLGKLALVSLAACAMIASAGAAPTRGNWTNMVVRTDGGHRVGNPEAKVSLIEFVSYTCPACANFSKNGDGALQIGYVASGRVNREIRHIIRDPVDLTAATLTHCGAPGKFVQNHAAFMARQDVWLPQVQNTTAAQRNRWQTGTDAARRRAIANDAGFYAIMERRGYRRTEIDRCLADDAGAKALAENSARNSEKYFVTSTPSFALNGVKLAGTHDWDELESQIKARLR